MIITLHNVLHHFNGDVLSIIHTSRPIKGVNKISVRYYAFFYKVHEMNTKYNKCVCVCSSICFNSETSERIFMKFGIRVH
jgi:hypothetical protein